MRNSISKYNADGFCKRILKVVLFHTKTLTQMCTCTHVNIHMHWKKNKTSVFVLSYTEKCWEMMSPLINDRFCNGTRVKDDAKYVLDYAAVWLLGTCRGVMDAEDEDWFCLYLCHLTADIQAQKRNSQVQDSKGLSTF
jgi:hypothetical protein